MIDYTYEKLNNTQKSRWIAMLIAVELIQKQCKSNKVNFDKVDLSPLPIKRFINEKSLQIEKELNQEDAVTINRDIKKKLFTTSLLKTAKIV